MVAMALRPDRPFAAGTAALFFQVAATKAAAIAQMQVIGMQMLLWALGSAALTGLLLGLFFRLPVLAIASAILIAIGCVNSIGAGSSAASAALGTAGSLLVLQGSYLAGLIISAWANELRKWSRVRHMRRSTAPAHLQNSPGLRRPLPGTADG